MGLGVKLWTNSGTQCPYKKSWERWTTQTFCLFVYFLANATATYPSPNPPPPSLPPSPPSLPPIHPFCFVPVLSLFCPSFPSIPIQVAFGLADLSTHEELHERIVKKGGCKSLIQLLTKSSDNEAQRFSALALANVASAVFNRISMVQDDVLQHLIAYITNEDSDFMGRQYCAMALGNLAAEPENHEDIVKLEGITSLVGLLKSEEVEASRYAAFALSNLAANANHRQQVSFWSCWSCWSCRNCWSCWREGGFWE